MHPSRLAYGAFLVVLAHGGPARAAAGEHLDWDFVCGAGSAYRLDDFHADRGTGDSQVSFAAVVGAGTYRGTNGLLSTTDDALFLGTYGPGTEWTRVDTFGADAHVNGITRLSTGVTVVSGDIGATATFGVGWPGDPATPVTYTATATQDKFLAFYGTTGAFTSLKKFGGITRPVVDASPAGPIFITGDGSSDDLYFGGAQKLVSRGFCHYLVKTSAAGVFGWARAADAGVVGVPAPVAALSNGAVLWSATFTTATDIDDGAGGTVHMTADFEDTFLVKYSQSGVLQWAVRTVSVPRTPSEWEPGVMVKALAADDQNNAYMLAFAVGEVTLGAGEANELTADYDREWIVIRFLANGTFDWVRRIAPDDGTWPNTGHMVPTSIAAGTAQQGAAVVGRFEGDDVEVFSGTADEEVWTLTGPTEDAWVVGLRSNGSIRFDKQLGGSGWQNASDVDFDPLRSVVTVTGMFASQIRLGEGDPNGPFIYQLANYQGPAGYFDDLDSGVAP